MRKLIVAGNWKMNHNPQQAADFMDGFVSADKPACEWVLFPPSLCWREVSEKMAGENQKWGLQHVHAEASGAFTGEVSMQMAKDIGCDYVLIGHSERRALFGETDEEVATKVKSAHERGLTPMICLGETLEQREAGETQSVVVQQLQAALKGVDLNGNFVLAYEPVWAIGTGKVATPDQAQEAHRFLREELRHLDGEKLANRTSILYGGSVKPENAGELSVQSEIDGFLIGGASLKVDSFIQIGKNSV